MKSMPFPSDSESHTKRRTLANDSIEPPWKRSGPTELPLMFFQIARLNGQVVSYAYCDLRELRLLSPGLLQLCIFGMEKYLITISGRHLTELANSLSLGKVKSILEVGPGSFEMREASPSIDKITIEELTGPSAG